MGSMVAIDALHADYSFDVPFFFLNHMSYCIFHGKSKW